jgi:hypothetical protein
MWMKMACIAKPVRGSDCHCPIESEHKQYASSNANGQKEDMGFPETPGAHAEGIWGHINLLIFSKRPPVKRDGVPI